MSLAQIGGLNESGILSVPYVESPASGIMETQRVYDANQMGWMRRKSVNVVYTVWKRDLAAARASVPSSPTNLTTIAGKNADGTEAARIVLGAGWTLKTISEAQLGASFVTLTCKYEKEIPEAQENLPAGLTITETLGVTSVTWQGVSMVQFNNGTGVNGTGGFQIIKLPRATRVVRVHNGTSYYDVTRVYNRCQLMFDTTVYASGEYMVSETNQTATVTAAGTAGETTLSESLTGTDYELPVYWTTYTADSTFLAAGNAGKKVAELYAGNLQLWRFVA